MGYSMRTKNYRYTEWIKWDSCTHIDTRTRTSTYGFASCEHTQLCLSHAQNLNPLTTSHRFMGQPNSYTHHTHTHTHTHTQVQLRQKPPHEDMSHSGIRNPSLGRRRLRHNRRRAVQPHPRHLHHLRRLRECQPGLHARARGIGSGTETPTALVLA